MNRKWLLLIVPGTVAATLGACVATLAWLLRGPDIPS